ncbi:hypothetical protein LY90DRAFT_425406, partial [Neocallimastix californiae]
DPPKDSPDNTSTSDCPVDDYPCCSPEITEVAYTDETGTWGVENDEWCLISVTVCFSEALGYPCCSDPNAAVVTTDEFGQWGIENNQWCGILGSETIVPTLIVITLPILCGIFHTLIMVIST